MSKHKPVTLSFSEVRKEVLSYKEDLLSMNMITLQLYLRTFGKKLYYLNQQTERELVCFRGLGL